MSLQRSEALHNAYCYLFGPSLYMEYHSPDGAGPPVVYYTANIIDRTAEQILALMSLLTKGLCYTLPLIGFVLYETNPKLTWELLRSAENVLISLGIIYVAAMSVRCYGRSQSPSYRRLVRALHMVRHRDTEMEGRFLLRAFDFDFDWWPVDFSIVDDLRTRFLKKAIHPPLPNVRCNLCILFKLPYTLIGYLIMYSFGIHIVYPGSIHVLQRYLQPALVDGRARLVQDHFGKRFKLKTFDENELDVMFIDNRGNSELDSASNGNVLVICCEGNVGFYEVGIMEAPLELRYSIIGWNHAGFAGSTGRPFPDQEKNAIEAVLQFAIHFLGFQDNRIMLHGWSIGCYTALWAATCYPNVRGVILDAPFDDIWPIVHHHSPSAFMKLIKVCVRDYCNLNLIDLIKAYSGPILIIRRTFDEIVTSSERIESNRGNRLAMFLLRYRYPNIFRAAQVMKMDNILEFPLSMNLFKKPPDDDLLVMKLVIGSASCEGSSTFPMSIGDDFDDDLRMQMAEFLLHKHMLDFEANHCEALPADYFLTPWTFC